MRKSFRKRHPKPSLPDPSSNLPAELQPIFPGGGSRFDDWEREKIQKRKLARLRKAKEAANKSKNCAFRSAFVNSDRTVFIVIVAMMQIFSYLNVNFEHCVKGVIQLNINNLYL